MTSTPQLRQQVKPPFTENESVYHRAISLFVEDMRIDQALSQGELASLDGGHRFFALVKGLLPNMVHLMRRAPRSDTKLGVMILVHLCADNNDGLCRLSVKRFSQILSRKEENIRKAIDELEEGGEIGVHRSVHGNSYWPRIARVVVNTSPNLGWFLDAFSDTPRRAGRPENTPPQKGVHFNGENVSPENTPPQTGKYPPAEGVHIETLSKPSNKREGSNKRGRTPQKTKQVVSKAVH